MEKKLNFNVLVEGFNLGLKNWVNLVLTTVLYVLTIWIPYLNVGTTIGYYKIIIALGKGEEIKPASIFSRENYKGLGDFFLLLGLKGLGIVAASIFFFIPALVVGLAWRYALYFLLDKKVSPLQALAHSYDATCGEKWMLFAILVVFGIAVSIVTSILGLIPAVGGVLSFLATLFLAAITMGIEATLYKYFASKVSE